MKHAKKLCAIVALAAVLGAAVPSRQANGGMLVLMVAPAFIGPWGAVAGLAVVVAGYVFQSQILIYLDENGNFDQSSLEQALATRYPFLSEDREAVRDLALLLREKALSGTPDAEGKIMVSLTEDDVLSVLEPTGLVESEPEQVAGLVQDLQ